MYFLFLFSQSVFLHNLSDLVGGSGVYPLSTPQLLPTQMSATIEDSVPAVKASPFTAMVLQHVIIMGKPIETESIKEIVFGPIIKFSSSRSRSCLRMFVVEDVILWHWRLFVGHQPKESEFDLLNLVPVKRNRHAEHKSKNTKLIFFNWVCKNFTKKQNVLTESCFKFVVKTKWNCFKEKL